MALNAQLQALTVPDGTQFPGTVQALLILIAQYEAITGLEDFNGINFGSTTPAPADRDKPWFQVDGGGNPIGWFSWAGSAWEPIPLVLPQGSTADRPASPAAGTQYFDTSINVALVFTGSVWTTLAGSPGDVKEVKAATLADALTKNPGWAHDAGSIGRVVAGAAADGSNYGDTVGADEVTITEDQLPAHVHPDLEVTGSEADNGDDGGFTIMANSQSIGVKTVTNSRTGSTGGDQPVDVRQQTIYYWRLVKS